MNQVVGNFESPRCKGQILLDTKKKIFRLQGKCRGKVIKYLASAPPDFRQSYSGSGLPFPNEEIAYSNTPNSGSVQVSGDGDFTVSLYYPNAYYVNQGSTLVQPHVHLVVDEQDVFDVKLGGPLLNNRSLKHLPGRPRRTTGLSYGTTGGIAK